MWAQVLCVVLTAGTEAPPEQPAVAAKMRASFAGLMAMQPYLASPARFSDPNNRKAIGGHLQALSSVQHAFPKKMAQEEPGLAAISQLFSSYLDETRRRWEQGDNEYARYRLRTVTGLCFSCHAQVRAEQDFVDVSRQVEALPLSPLERADYLAATRQFEPALQAYREVLKPTPRGEQGYLDFLRALRHGLSLLVRVKQDPATTQALLSELSARKDLPPFLLEYVAGWKADVQRWQKDRFNPSKASVPELVKKAQTLVMEAGGPQTVMPDERLEIPFLRATGYLHQALRKEPTSAMRGEALYLLGVSYAALQDPMLWELDALYLESCVRENPHTAVARKCLRRLTDRVFLGYTGSRGTHVPGDELERLAQLRKLAE